LPAGACYVSGSAELGGGCDAVTTRRGRDVCADSLRMLGGTRLRLRRSPIAVCLLAMVGLTLALAPAAGASPGTVRKVRVRVTRAELRHGYLALARELRTQSQRARAAIVGGSPISIEKAPWQVVVQGIVADGPEEVLVLTCGGSILNESEILTAGHCVFDPLTGTKIPADQMVVGAGISNLKVIAPEEQVSVVSQVRPHPYYNPDASLPAPDDVAVLKLEKPFVLSRLTAQSIAVTPAGSFLQEGAAVNLTGFGLESPLAKELAGPLNSIGMTVASSERCGGLADALFVCASTPTGSLCSGDSGGALTLGGSSATLVGVTDTVEVISGEPCRDGALGGFANVAAPEIHDFIEGSESPPRAPRGGAAIEIRGFITVGQSLTCSPGSWENSPTFTYTFINGIGDQILQTGSSDTYSLTSADVGRTILCEVHAANAGGTGILRTGALPPIKAAPLPPAPTPVSPVSPAPTTVPTVPVESAAGGVAGYQVGVTPQVPDAKLASTALQASASGAVSIKVSCPAAESNCAGTVTLRTLNAVIADLGSTAKTKASILTLATGSFSVAGGKVETVTLHLTAKARKLLAASHVLHARATIVAHDPSGATHTTQTTVTLRAPKVGHGKG